VNNPALAAPGGFFIGAFLAVVAQALSHQLMHTVGVAELSNNLRATNKSS